MTAPLDLDALSNQVRPLDEAAAAAARDRLSALSTPAGSLGRLADLAGWLAGAQGVAPPRDLARARVVVFAGDHGIAAAGVSAYPPETTARLVALIGSGDAAVSVLARVAGATVRVVDVAVDADTAADLSTHKVRRGSGRIDRQDALTLAEAERAFAAGVAIADEEVDGGADLLIPGELGIGVTAVAAVLVAALTDTEPVKVIGRGSGIDDPTWMRKLTAIRDGLRRGRPFVADPVALLAASGGADLAAMAGFLVQAAVRRTPVLLDGVASAAAGLVASAIAPAAPAWWLAAHRSSEPAHRVALEWLDLRPVIDPGVRLDDGTGALLVLPLLRSAVRSCAEIATAEQAGIHRLSTPSPTGKNPDATGADGTDLDADHPDAAEPDATGLDGTGDPAS